METTTTPQFKQHHRLALALEWAGVDNAEMAAELGVHRNTISNYLNGHTKPSKAVLRVWAIRTGAPVAWLEFGTVTDPDGGTVTLRHWFGNEGDIPSLDRRYPWSDHQMSFDLIAS